MFGKTPRGVSERPKTNNSKTIPSWLWLIIFVLVALAALIYLSLFWKPWTPVKKSTNQPTATSENIDTNKDYRFYDLLPQQQVTPIPEQAVPAHQAKQSIVVIEAPNAQNNQATKGIEDPFDENYQAAQISIEPRYILQIRSYEDPDHADARRAEIVLNGLSAEVIMSNEGQKVWYRVISGPYQSQEAAHIAQQTLQNSGIDSIIVKQSGSAN